MQFSDTTNKSGMIQECETWLFGNNYGAISGDSDLLATFTRLINYGLDETVTRIMSVDGRWQYGDSNFTTHPIATTTMVNGQQDYALDVSHLKILGVEVKDSTGNWQVVTQLDMQDIRRKGMALTEFMEEDAMPRYYDLVGDSIFLYPAPATAYVTLTNGLKVYFQREPDYFTTSDTTQTPGFPSVFHDIPVLFACAKYAKSNQISEKSRELDAEIIKRTGELTHFYTKRNVDGKARLRTRYKSSR